MTLFDFLHITRPYWLIAIPVTLLLALLFDTNASKQNTLTKVVDKHLLPYLEYKNTSNNTNKWLGIMAIIFCWVGLSGISWTQVPTVMFENTQKTVFVVDQSLSMYATDIKPNRQTQLKQTIRDILEQTKEGEIALVAFAGEGFVISPFSQDRETITHFLLALDPIIMPVYGSNLSDGIKTALSLNKDDSIPLHLIILTDDLNSEDKTRIPSLLNNANVQLDIIAVGTKKGSFIRTPDGQILKRNGQNIIPTVPIDDLKSLANNLNGHFHQGRLSASEVTQITNTTLDNTQTQEAENKSIHWVDQGHWLALPFLLWLAFQFRRGMLLTLFIGFFLLPTDKLQAAPLDLFLTQDQKGQQAADQGDWETAEQLFTRPDWKAASSYTLKNYSLSIENLEKLDRNAAENYNLGNAFALSGETEKAIQAYKKALEQNPSLKEAKENLAYLEKKQQEQQKQDKKEQQENNQQKQDQKNDQEKNNKENSNHKNNQDEQQEQSDSNDQNNEKDASELEKDNEKDNKKDETQDKEKTPEDNKQDEQTDSQEKQNTANAELNKEQTQALNQWLKQIQDDPGLLLQRKLWYQHQEKRNENRFTQKDGQNPW